MSNPFVDALRRSFDHALSLLEAGLLDCPDSLWETDLWADAPTAPSEWGGLHGSAPWFLGYHALLTLDYDLTAELGPWVHPPDLDDHTWSMPNRAFTRAELLSALAYCRARVTTTLDSLTDERAATPVPSSHRWSGMTYGSLIGTLPLHTVEHAAQLRQFLADRGVAVRAMPGDRHYVADAD